MTTELTFPSFIDYVIPYQGFTKHPERDDNYGSGFFATKEEWDAFVGLSGDLAPMYVEVRDCQPASKNIFGEWQIER